jgi:hypothetical protein
VYEVKGIGDGIEDHPGTAKNAGTLADRTRKALFFARYIEYLTALLIYLPFSFF